MFDPVTPGLHTQVFRGWPGPAFWVTSGAFPSLRGAPLVLPASSLTVRRARSSPLGAFPGDRIQARCRPVPYTAVCRSTRHPRALPAVSAFGPQPFRKAVHLDLSPLRPSAREANSLFPPCAWVIPSSSGLFSFALRMLFPKCKPCFKFSRPAHSCGAASLDSPQEKARSPWGFKCRAG